MLILKWICGFLDLKKSNNLLPRSEKSDFSGQKNPNKEEEIIVSVHAPKLNSKSKRQIKNGNELIKEDKNFTTQVSSMDLQVSNIKKNSKFIYCLEGDTIDVSEIQYSEEEIPRTLFPKSETTRDCNNNNIKKSYYLKCSKNEKVEKIVTKERNLNYNTGSKNSQKTIAQNYEINKNNYPEGSDFRKYPNKNEFVMQNKQNFHNKNKIPKSNRKYNSLKPTKFKLTNTSNKSTIKEKYDKLYCSISKANQLLKFNSLYPRKMLRNSTNISNLMNSSYQLKNSLFKKINIISQLGLDNKTEEERNNNFPNNASEILDSKSSVIRPSNKSEFKFPPYILKGSVASNGYIEYNATSTMKLKEESTVTSFITHHRRSCLNQNN